MSTATVGDQLFQHHQHKNNNKEDKQQRCHTAGIDNYVGQHKKAIRHGYGIYTYTNRFFHYEGEWVDGKKHGLGKLLMKDGSYYSGEFHNGEIEGNGIRHFRLNGNTYTGSFHKGELHGQGIMEYKNGSVYEGSWAFNKREGHGTLKEKDGSTYDGSFHQHKKHGYGSMAYQNGDHYIGDWVQDQRHGHGTYTTSDGTFYEGQWANDVISGLGSIRHSSGMTYDGQWINGMPLELATKLFFIPNNDILYIDNEKPFSIKVQCHNDDKQLIPDQGRKIQIIAGIQNPVTQNTSSQEADDADNMDNNLIATPFGYSILPCQLNMPLELCPQNIIPMEHTITDENTENTDENENAQENNGHLPERTAAKPEEPDPFLPLTEEMTIQTTNEGKVVWENLLPPKSVFLEKKTSVHNEVQKKPGKHLTSGTATPKAQKTQEKEEQMAQEIIPSNDTATSVVEKTTDIPSEFVLVAKDVTDPPFMNQRIQTGFLKIKIKKTKRWDSARTISRVTNIQSPAIDKEEPVS